MSSPHNAAEIGDIAETILLPGDPLRAKHIAENFLTDAVQYTSIRNNFGFTGKYKGNPISVQSTGMGIPSMCIYAHELIETYGVRKLFRVGTCGAMHADVKVRDVLLAQGATTDSSIIRNIFGASINFAPLANFDLLSSAVKNAARLNIPTKVGNIVTVDRFYDEEIDQAKLVKYGVLAVEMETAGLYTIAAQFGAKALSVLTVSDSFVTHEVLSAEEREKNFNDMIELALETAIES